MLKFYWSNSRPNFGDILTPYILDYFNISYEMCPDPQQSNAMCIGSIIHRATDNMIVLGSGLIRGKHKPNIHANYRFVRGPVTRNQIINLGGTCPEIYGDPALLLPLFCDESKKEYDVGIVPHYVDHAEIVKKYPNYKIINLTNKDPIEVAKEITKCRTIVSTSLHGIIAAHAYGIPAAWYKFSNKLKGDDIKFRDYFASVKIETNYFKKLNDVKFSKPIIPNLNNLTNKFEELI